MTRKYTNTKVETAESGDISIKNKRCRSDGLWNGLLRGEWRMEIT